MSNLFFFDTAKVQERASVSLRSALPTPETGWRPLKDFPNFDNAYIIGRDRETRELDFDNGPGWARGKGYVVGEAFTFWDRDLKPFSFYMPKHHEVEPEYNMDPDNVTRYANDVDATPMTKIYANMIYDDGYGTDLSGGKLASGEKHDVQFAEALLSETDLTALDALIRKYGDGITGKNSNQMYEWGAACYGGNPTGSQRANIYRMSPRLVGPYAMSDTSELLTILMKQVHDLNKQGLYDVYRMECEIAGLLILMRRRGVRIDLEKAEKLYEEMGPLIATKEQALAKLVGFEVNVNSNDDLEKAFNKLNVRFPRTPKTEPTAKNPQGGGDNPSFTAEFLNACEHEIGEAIVDIRQHQKLKATFLKSYILDSHYNGRIHGQYHPLKGEAGGTRVGRLSSSTPNLQNIPSRTELGRQIRTMFLPDEGSLCLEKGDHSQLQYRLLAHFAVDANNHYGVVSYGDGPTSNALRAEYNADPHTDYHTRTQKMVKAVSGLYIPRSSEEASDGRMVVDLEPGTFEWAKLYKEQAKLKKAHASTVEWTHWSTGRFTIKETNFGLMFGMGKKKLIKQSALPTQKGEDVFNAYHQGNPYVKATMDYFSRLAEEQGYVLTVMNRRTRFDKWIKKGWSDEQLTPLEFGHALREWGSGNIVRAGAYKALCNVLQGSEGEVIKTGMLAAWKAGVFDVVGVPLLTTHDEVVLDIPDDSPRTREAMEFYRYTMANSLKLRIPLVYESTRGPDWSAAKTPVEEWVHVA